MELAERVALVTGGGRGIGQAVARKLATLGADVVVSARTRAEIETVAAEIRATGRRAHAIVADVGDRSGDGRPDESSGHFGQQRRGHPLRPR